MFKQILVPLDGSTLAECTLPHAVALARAFTARIVLLRVLEQPDRDEVVLPVDPLDWEMKRAESQAYLDRLRRHFQTAGVEAETLTLEGQPTDRIVEHAHEARIDLILLSSHGRSGLSGSTIGSVVQKIILRSRTSIMIVRAFGKGPANRAALQYRRIAVPLDGSRRAESILSPVSTLARHFDARIRLLHVVRKPEIPQADANASAYQELSEQMTALSWQESTRYLEKVRSWLPPEVVIDLAVSENVAESLQKLAEEAEADLVALSAHGRSEGTRRMHGSITTSFIMYGSAPLLIVQDLEPENFQDTPAEIASRERKGH